MIIELALDLVLLTSPDHQAVEINPSEIISIRTPRQDHVHTIVKCMIYTVDGKFIPVLEDCKTVSKKIGSPQ